VLYPAVNARERKKLVQNVSLDFLLKQYQLALRYEKSSKSSRALRKGSGSVIAPKSRKNIIYLSRRNGEQLGEL
jgi:hypothetical protein